MATQDRYLVTVDKQSGDTVKVEQVGPDGELTEVATEQLAPGQPQAVDSGFRMATQDRYLATVDNQTGDTVKVEQVGPEGELTEAPEQVINITPGPPTVSQGDPGQGIAVGEAPDPTAPDYPPAARMPFIPGLPNVPYRSRIPFMPIVPGSVPSDQERIGQ